MTRTTEEVTTITQTPAPTKHDLAALAERVAEWLTPERWTTNVLARDTDGILTHPLGKDAVSWCVAGAAIRLGGRKQTDALTSAYWQRYHSRLASDNDASRRGLPVVRSRLLELAAHLLAS